LVPQSGLQWARRSVLPWVRMLVQRLAQPSVLQSVLQSVQR